MDTDLNDYIIQMPVYEGAELPDGVELKGCHIFLSPPGCCAQTTLPFWAKVAGKINNSVDRELLISITVHLVGADDAIIKSHGESMALDSKQTGEFDIKLVEYDEKIRKYSLEIKEIGEDQL